MLKSLLHSAEFYFVASAEARLVSRMAGLVLYPYARGDCLCGDKALPFEAQLV